MKVFAGDSKKPVAKFSTSKELFEYMKQANGKICDVRWIEVKDMIENWMNTFQSAEASVGDEIKILVAEQAAPSQPSPAPAPSTQPVAQATQPSAQPSAQPAAQSPKSCDAQLMLLRERLSALKSKAYNSQKIRTQEIESILRSL